jgi:hypothetical protein
MKVAVQQDAVATGSWPLMIEHCGGRRQRRPRPDLGCSAIGWMEVTGMLRRIVW